MGSPVWKPNYFTQRKGTMFTVSFLMADGLRSWVIEIGWTSSRINFSNWFDEILYFYLIKN